MNSIPSHKPQFAGVFLGHKPRNDEKNIYPFRYMDPKNQVLMLAHVTDQNAVELRKKVGRVVDLEKRDIEANGNRMEPRSQEQLEARADLSTFEQQLEARLGLWPYNPFIIPSKPTARKRGEQLKSHAST